MAPQAMVMNKNGHMGGALAGESCTAGATISRLPPKAVKRTPKVSNARATINWCELIKSRGCSKVVTGKIDAIKAYASRMMVHTPVGGIPAMAGILSGR